MDRFSRPIRTKILYAALDHVPAKVSAGYPLDRVTPELVQNAQAALLIREWGSQPFRGAGAMAQYTVDNATDPEVVDIVESWFPAMRLLIEANDQGDGFLSYNEGPGVLRVLTGQYRDRINEILDDGDIAWQLLGEEMLPRSSTAMHATIIEPVLALAAGRNDLVAVEKAYTDALRELKPGGDPSDAITDAGTALQAMLEIAGAKGNALGPLLTDARKRTLLAPYDSKLAEAIEALGEWVAADRSQRGDAHHVGDASREDAWLAVRVAGALILRLAAGKRR